MALSRQALEGVPMSEAAPQASAAKPTWGELRRRFTAWLRTSPAAWSVLLANLMPLVGVIWFGADAFSIVLLYWLENLVIGCFNVPKIILARGGYRSYFEMYLGGPALVFVPIMVPFFIFHYGMFCYGHGSLLFHLFGQDVPHGQGLSESFLLLLMAVRHELTLAMGLSLLALTLEHAHAFYAGFWKAGTYTRMPCVLYFFMPYGRVALVHIVLLTGAILTSFLSLPATVVGILLIIFKVGPELVTVWIADMVHRYGGQPAPAVALTRAE
jgi:hypothetical protein